MKKVVAVALSAVCLLSMAACGAQKNKGPFTDEKGEAIITYVDGYSNKSDIYSAGKAVPTGTNTYVTAEKSENPGTFDTKVVNYYLRFYYSDNNFEYYDQYDEDGKTDFTICCIYHFISDEAEEYTYSSYDIWTFGYDFKMESGYDSKNNTLTQYVSAFDLKNGKVNEIEITQETSHYSGKISFENTDDFNSFIGGVESGIKQAIENGITFLSGQGVELPTLSSNIYK